MANNKVKNINKQKIIGYSILAVILTLVYQFIFIDMKYFDFAIQIRFPKLMSIIIAAFCIGTATIVFQSVINNRIVTPCLLGMNSLYTLIHTSIAFAAGTSSILVINKNISFVVDVIAMGILATIIYGYLFKKTKYNVLYVLLAGTVIATLFTSITNTMIRVMDPNEYSSLQDRLIAGFNNANSDILIMAIILIVLTIVVFRKDIKILDVITLGRNQAINLGVDYDKAISRLLLAVTIFIAIATALVGPISFLGLIIANISRELFKTYKHSYLMMGSFLSGVIVLLLGQILIEHVFSFSTVISVFINLFGGIYFLYLIVKNKGV